MSNLKLASPVEDRSEEWAEFSLAVQEALVANDKVREGFTERGLYKSPAFEFVRQIKLHPMLADFDRYDAAELVERAFCEIQGAAFGSDDAAHIWVELLGDTNSRGKHVDPYDDFLVCWERCKHPGPDVLERAVKSARDNPRPVDYFGERVKTKRREKYRTFLTVSEELQLVQGDKPICLPVGRLAVLLQTDESQISTWRKLAVDDGFLEPVAKYKIRQRASEFLFHLPPKAS